MPPCSGAARALNAGKKDSTSSALGEQAPPCSKEIAIAESVTASRVEVAQGPCDDLADSPEARELAAWTHAGA